MRMVIAVLLAGLGGCTRNWAVRTTYTSKIEADFSQRSTVECGLDSAPYSNIVGYTQSTSGGGKWTKEEWLPLKLTLANRTGEIVTVDWDHSAIVLGNVSYAIELYEQPKNSPDVEAVKKPPVPVLAPNSFIAVLVLPEMPRPSAGKLPEPVTEAVPPNRFLPTSAEQQSTLRVVLALTGWSAPYVDCAFRARLVNTLVSRSTADRWPGPGESCVPEFQWCAEGLSCLRDRCVDPTKEPTGKKFGESCVSGDECWEGLTCQAGRCLGEATKPLK